MSDYISRPELIASCEGRYCAPCKERGGDHNGIGCRACWVGDILGEVLDYPAADVESVRHGWWDVNRRCSECGLPAPLAYSEPDRWESPYCPNCGAKMDLEDENNG